MATMVLARVNHRKPNPGGPGSVGFTLLELLVVLSIIVLTLAVALPNLGAGTGLTVRSSVYSLAGELRRTRDLAMTTNRARVLNFDVDRKRYKREDAETFESLPSDVSFSITSARSLLIGERVGGIRFFPDGTTSGGRIIVSRASQSYVIDVDWLTGTVSVVDAGER